MSRPKGTRGDGVTLEKLASAINTGRAQIYAVHRILGAMFGVDHANAWDETMHRLNELMSEDMSK